MTEDPAKRFTFDRKIRVDTVLISLGGLVSVTGLVVMMQMQIANNARDIIEAKREATEMTARVEAQDRERSKGIVDNFMDKMKDQRIYSDNVNLTVAANISDIKNLLVRMDEKLDKKADKVGYGR